MSSKGSRGWYQISWKERLARRKYYALVLHAAASAACVWWYVKGLDEWVLGILAFVPFALSALAQVVIGREVLWLDRAAMVAIGGIFFAGAYLMGYQAMLKFAALAPIVVLIDVLMHNKHSV